MSNIDEIFKPENKSIRQIFGDTDAFYQIPDFLKLRNVSSKF